MAIFDFYVEVDLKQNLARVWREGYVPAFHERNPDEDIALVEKDLESYKLVRRDGKFYLIDEGGNQQEIGEDEAKQLVADTILDDLGDEYLFDGREDQVEVDFESNRVKVVEAPQLVDIFDRDGRFYLDPEGEDEWIQKTQDGYALFRRDRNWGKLISEERAKSIIEDALLTTHKKKLFPRPDRPF